MVSKFFNLIFYRAAAELRSEGTRTYAGYLWWILDPLLSLAVYYVAFKYILHRGTDDFAIFLFSGIVIYRFFAGTVTRSAGSILNGHGLMQLVYVHKSIFPLSVVMVNLVKFMITLLLVIVISWLFRILPTWAYLALPLLIVLELMVITGASMICAAITPFFPDFQLALGTIMHLLIFLSGVFYDVSKLSPRIKALINLNPLAVMIEQYRAILLHGQWPNLQPLVPVLVESIIFLAIGWLLIHKFNRYFPKLS
jgi:lipopolysaccharide transport system permease protein